MIAAAEIERLKRDVDLVKLVQSRGIALRRRGLSWQGRCPFHEDKNTPSFSITPDKGLWRCFGCGIGGDAIRFVELHDKLHFRDAVKALGGNGVAQTTPIAVKEKRSTEKPSEPKSAACERTQAELILLGQVADFYRQTFLHDPRGAAYLAERGIHDAGLLETFRVGFSGGVLLEKLPDAGERVDALRSLGILTDRKTELFYGSVVFPLCDTEGNVVSFYGRRILPGETRHLYLPGKRRGLFNQKAGHGSGEVIVVEGILDALALIQAGFAQTLALDGIEGLRDEHLTLFRDHQTRDIYIAMDGDDAGAKAATRVAARLNEIGLCPTIVTLPSGKDPADFLRDGGQAAFESLLREADAAVAERESMPFHRSRHGYTQTPEGFRVVFGTQRVYDVRGIAKTLGHLRCAVRAAHGIHWHQDALDLYAARARERLIAACSKLFASSYSTIADDLAHLLRYAEEWSPAQAPSAPAIAAMSDGERAEALSYLSSPDLLRRITDDLRIIGSVGEEDNRLLGYLAALSRKLAEPLSCLIISRSAAGKSHLAESITKLVPPEELRRYTRVTGQALFYTETDALANKLIAIEEAAGAEDAAYSIRTLQSSGELRVAVTTKDPRDGRLRTDEYVVKGPVSFLVTSTSSDLDPETQSRFLILAVDESQKATERILHAQRESETLAGLTRRKEAQAIIKRHHALQRMLEPIAIVNPLAPKLRFPTHTLRARRDHKKYLALIQTIAFLHQHQRPHHKTQIAAETVSYIEVTPSDVLFANRLARVAFARTLDELSPQARALLAEVRSLCEEQAQGEVKPEYVFRRRDLRRKSGWSETQIRRHLAELEQHEYIEPVLGRQGKEYLYHLACDQEGQPLALDLVTEAELLAASPSS